VPHEKRTLPHTAQHSLTMSRIAPSLSCNNNPTPRGLLASHVGSRSVLTALDTAECGAIRRVQRGERPGFPRFKARKRDAASFEIPAETRFDGCRVKIPGIGWVRARGGRDIATTTTTARYFCDGAGDWWAALRYTVPLSDADVSDISAVGVHLEPGHAMTLSMGESINESRDVSRSDRKLRRLKRVIGRTKPGSGNRRRADGSRVQRGTSRINAGIGSIKSVAVLSLPIPGS